VRLCCSCRFDNEFIVNDVDNRVMPSRREDAFGQSRSRVAYVMSLHVHNHVENTPRLKISQGLFRNEYYRIFCMTIENCEPIYENDGRRSKPEREIQKWPHFM
jgi:hypothetical protein